VLINWFTVVAQIVNFLVLVALLKRFLYGPVVSAMAARESRIAGQLTDARNTKQEAEMEEASLRRKILEIEEERIEKLAEADRQADVYKKELFSRAREEVEEIRRKWTASMAREKDTFLRNVKQRIAREVLTIARRALRDMGSMELEQRLVEVFLDRLRQLTPKEQAAVRESAMENGGELTIGTSLELPEAVRQSIVDRVREQLGRDLTLKFTTSKELVAGIELVTSSRKVAWSLASFLDTLEEDLSQAFQELAKKENP
jgi:F-type H+-transporting ATPase subunit b